MRVWYVLISILGKEQKEYWKVKISRSVIGQVPSRSSLLDFHPTTWEFMGAIGGIVKLWKDDELNHEF